MYLCSLFLAASSFDANNLLLIFSFLFLHTHFKIIIFLFILIISDGREINVSQSYRHPTEPKKDKKENVEESKQSRKPSRTVLGTSDAPKARLGLSREHEDGPTGQKDVVVDVVKPMTNADFRKFL